MNQKVENWNELEKEHTWGVPTFNMKKYIYIYLKERLKENKSRTTFFLQIVDEPTHPINRWDKSFK